MKPVIGKSVKNLLGKKFGRLSVIEFAGYLVVGQSGDRRAAAWKVKCDCGVEKTVRGNDLTTGLQSCGCLLKEFRLNHLPHLASNRLINRYNKKSDVGFSQIYSQYYYRAIKKSLPFTIKKEDFYKLITLPCTYCGRPPSREMKCRTNTFRWNGLDRIDNSGGYELHNCVPCCSICNKARNSMEVSEFKLWIKDLVNFQKDKYETC